jgi:hypothetical protein
VLGCRVVGFKVVGCNVVGCNVVGCNVVGCNVVGCNVVGFNVVGFNVVGFNVVGRNLVIAVYGTFVLNDIVVDTILFVFSKLLIVHVNVLLEIASILDIDNVYLPSGVEKSK